MVVNLAAVYATRLHASTQQVPVFPGPSLTPADAAGQPAALQRPGQAWLPGPAEQFNVVQTLRREVPGAPRAHPGRGGLADARGPGRLSPFLGAQHSVRRGRLK